jgi:hypothetical protein
MILADFEIISHRFVCGVVAISDARDRVAELHIKRLTIISARLDYGSNNVVGIKKE